MRDSLYACDLKLRRRGCRAMMLRGRKAARADRGLRADEKHIRTQSAILDETPTPCWVFNHNRVFRTDDFYPSGNHGWRAQRANPLANSLVVFVAKRCSTRS